MSRKRKINSPLRHLGFVPFGMPDESPISIIKRAAAANGFRDCSQLMQASLQQITGSKKQTTPGTNDSLFCNRAVSLALQNCAPDHYSEIASGFYRATNNLMKRPDAIIKGVIIKHMLIRCSAAFCSECFKTGYERFTRDINFFINCPFHNCGLIDNCPACSEKLHWQTLLTNRCRCGQLLISPSRLTTDMANDHYLLHLMESRNDHEVTLMQTIYETLELATTHQTELVRTIGIRDLAIAISRVDIKEIADIFPHFFSCTNKDEISLTTGVLTKYLNQKQVNSTKKLLTAQALNINVPPPLEKLTQAGLIACLHISFSKWESTKTKPSLAALLSTSKIYDIKTAIAIQKILKEESKGMTNRDLTQKPDIYGHILSLEQASKQTGLPVKAIYDLCRTTKLFGRHKCIVGPQRAPTIGISHIRNFNETHICSQLLSQQLNTPLKTIESKIKELNLEAKESRQVNCEPFILKSNLGRLIAGISGVPFERPKRARTSKQLRQADPLNEPDLLDTTECAKILNIAPSFVLSLIREGRLPCEAKNRHERLIKQQDALDFKETYLNSSAIRELLEIPTKNTSLFLESYQILPAFTTPPNRSRMIFFKISDLVKAQLLRYEYDPTLDKKIIKPVATDFDQSIPELCNRLHITARNFLYFFKHNSAIAYRTVNRKLYTNKEGAKIITNTITSKMTIAQAAKILKVPKSCIVRIIKKEDRLPPDVSHKPFVGLIKRSTVDRLLLESADKPGTYPTKQITPKGKNS